MSGVWFSFIMAAGAGLLVYLKIGRGIGYSNGQTVWIITCITFALAFVFVFTLTRYVIHTT
jgi:hypothetical protein